MKDCAEFYCRQSVEKVIFRIVAICISNLERLIQISLLIFRPFPSVFVQPADSAVACFNKLKVA